MGPAAANGSRVFAAPRADHGGLLIGAVVIVVGNTIRLDIQNRSAEIEVAKLLGATDGFVRRPFLYLGLWYGLLGGLVAVLVLVLGGWALMGPMARLAGLYDSHLSLQFAPLSSLLTVLGEASWRGGGLGVPWPAICSVSSPK